MAKLSYQQRQNLPASAFVFPKTREYPVPDPSHARNALARVSRFGTPYQKAKVCRAVSRRFPRVHAHSCAIHRHRLVA